MDDRAGGGKTNILVVDDEEAIRELTALVLDMEGYAVTCSATFSDAMEQLRTGAYQALLTDVDLLHDESGLDLVRFVRGHELPMAVVVMSARRSNRGPATEAGADHVLDKPFEVEMFVAIIRRALTHSSAHATAP